MLEVYHYTYFNHLGKYSNITHYSKSWIGSFMDLREYRLSDSEIERTDDLEKMFPKDGNIALDIGARDGHFSKILAGYFNKVLALDLSMPSISHEKIECVKGDITKLTFTDGSFDFVFCSEVLEHIPVKLLRTACNELSRVTKTKLLIGVPYKQDIRVGRTKCVSCGKNNPPWGHVNSFDEKKLADLFPKLKIESISYVGSNDEATNFLSSFLLDIAGNPYGTYEQEEPCVYCDEVLQAPENRTFLQKIVSKFAYIILKIQQPFIKPHANWIHILFSK